jgi:hypothetical protein
MDSSSAYDARAIHLVIQALETARAARNFTPSHPYILKDIAARLKESRHQTQLVYLRQLTHVNDQHEQEQHSKKEAVDAFFMMHAPAATPSGGRA